MEYPKCATCKWSKPEPQWLLCTRPSAEDHLFTPWNPEDAEQGIYVHPEFGCIQHEGKAADIRKGCPAENIGMVFGAMGFSNLEGSILRPDYCVVGANGICERHHATEEKSDPPRGAEPGFIPVCVICESPEVVAVIVESSERRALGDYLCAQHIESGDVTLPRREEKA